MRTLHLWPLLILVVGCGDDGADSSDGGPTADAGRFDGGAPDTGPSPYGDGVCTESEVQMGEEATRMSMELAAGGPGLVSAYIEVNRDRLDGIWADCTEELCPFLVSIYQECWSKFPEPDGGVEDGGLPPANPCGDPPPECLDL